MPGDEPRRPAPSLVRAAGMISAVAIVSRVLGYVRESVLAARFGASSLTDAYLTAQDLPLTLNLTLVGALVAVFIPVYREVLQKRGLEAARRLTSTVMNVTLAVVTVLTLIGMMITPTLADLLVPGFTPELKAMTASLLLRTLPALVILAASGVFSAFLNGNQRFAGPALAGLPQNLAIIVAVVLVPRPEDVDLVALGVVVGALLGLLIQLPWVRGIGFRYQPLLDLRDPAMARMGSMIMPIMLTYGVQQVQLVIDRVLASGQAPGSIAALNFANRISSLSYGVIGVAITTVLFPTLSELSAARRIDDLKETVSKGLRTLTFLLVPMATGVLVFREELTRLIFERGAFTAGGTLMTAEALKYYALGILFLGWTDLMNRTFYAVQDSRTPLIVAVASVASYVVAALVLVGPLAHAGLALALSVSGVVSAAIMLYSFRRRFGPLGGRQILRSLVLGLAGSVPGAGLGILLLRAGTAYLGAGAAVQAGLLVAALGLIVVCHVGLALALKTPDGQEVRRLAAGVAGRSWR